MRVFELAKQLGITSKDLIGDLKGIGVTVSNHMAALEDDTVAKILAKAAGKAQKPASLVKLPKTVEAVKPGRPLGEKPDKPDKADKEKVRIAALKAKKTPPPVAEPPKAEKKMILVKRRPSETALVGDVAPLKPVEEPAAMRDRKSTRLNSSHLVISYAVFCLKKKKPTNMQQHGQLDQQLYRSLDDKYLN